MAVIITPTKEQWETLREIGIFDGEAVVLVAPDIAEKFDEDDLIDFGGEYEINEADVWLDTVSYESHPFVEYLREQMKERA